MSESASGPGGTLVETLTGDVGLAGRPAKSLASECSDVDALVEYLRTGNQPSEIDGVGNTSSNRLWDWFKDEYPEAYRERLENDEAYCTSFTTDHEIPEEEQAPETFYFAFICPRDHCEEKNPLKGSPLGFRNRPFKCEACNWVSCLEGEALESFFDNLSREEKQEVEA